MKTCRDVCNEWKQFIDARVWGCHKYKSTIIRWVKIFLNLFCKYFFDFRRLWRDFDPSVRTLSLVQEQKDYITSVCCDDNFIFCGYANGTCKLFR